MLFRIVLWCIAALLASASRVSTGVRAQLARDMTILIESRDGVARVFTIRDRRISSRAGSASNATCTLRFRTAAIGARTFLSVKAIDEIVDGLGNADIECNGEAAVVLWFYQLTMGLLPGRERATEVWPASYVAPNAELKASSRIIREPAVAMLDPLWTDAHLQREKLSLWRVGLGNEPAGKVMNHKIVVAMTPGAPEQQT